MEPIKISTEWLQLLRRKCDIAKTRHWIECLKVDGWRKPVEFMKTKERI